MAWRRPGRQFHSRKTLATSMTNINSCKGCLIMRIENDLLYSGEQGPRLGASTNSAARRTQATTRAAGRPGRPALPRCDTDTKLKDFPLELGGTGETVPE